MGSKSRGLTLPRTKPTHYGLSLFNLELGGSWGYDGIIKIDAKIVCPTSEIVLNAKQIDIQTAEISAKDGEEISARLPLCNCGTHVGT